MEMFVAWYVGDPEYQSVDINCNIVVSLTNVPKGWTIKRWRFPPRKLIVNSGTPYRRTMLEFTNPKDILLHQLNIIDDFKGDVFICPPDIPFPRKISTQFNKDEILKQNLQNASLYYQEFQKLSSKFPNVKLLGIIHGYDNESLLRVAKELSEIGYQYFALGSQEAKSRLDRGSIASFINALRKIVRYLHVLGVTSVDLHRRYLPLSLVDSVDSSTPVKEAFTNGLYFSNPLRRFKICTERLNVSWIKGWGYANLVCNPFRVGRCKRVCEQINENLRYRIVDFKDLPSCNCPVCKKFGQIEGLFRIGRKVYNNRRALHNYFHLKKEFESVLENPFVERSESENYIY